MQLIQFFVLLGIGDACNFILVRGAQKISSLSMKPADKSEWFRSVSSHNYEAVRASVERFRRCVDNNDETGLMLATRTNDLEMVKILAKYEAGSFNKNFQTALMIAAARDYTEICKVLAPLEKHVTLPDGRTALMLCAAAGSYDTVRAICKDFGVERDSSDWTALDHACAEGHHDCAKVIARSPAYNIEDIDKAIMIAESFGNNAIADALRDIRNDLEAKIRSCKRCQETSVELRILEKENRRLHEKVQELEDKALDLASQVETARSKTGSRGDNVPNSLELMYEVAKRDLEDKCREYENLKEDFVTLQNEYQDVRNQLRIMSESVEELTNPNSKLAKRMGIRDEREEELLRLKAENERLDEEVEKLRKYIDEDVVSATLFNSVEQNLKNVINIKDQEITRLEEKIQQNFVDVEALERKVLEAQHIKEQLLKLQNEHAEARNETFVQNEAILELKDELARQKSSDGRTARQLEDEIAELRALLANKSEEFEHLKSDMYEVIAHTTMAAGNEDALKTQLSEKEKLIQELEVKLSTRRAECERLQQKNLDLNDDLTYLAEEMSKAQGPGAPGLESIVASSRIGANRTGSIGGTRSFVGGHPGANTTLGGNTMGYTRELDESLRASFDANASVAEVDITSETLLMKAAAAGDVQSVRKLIYQAGSANNLGKTAMMYAAEGGHLECVRALMLKEARMQDDEGRTALFYASWHGHTEIVRLLVDREARLVKKNGYSSLMVAAVHGHVEICKLLLAKERGLYTNKAFRHGAGHTALMCAADWGDIECVKLLLSAEAHMRDRAGRMAFNFAKTEEVRSIISDFINRSHIEVADSQRTTTDGLHRKILERDEYDRPENYKEQIERIVQGSGALNSM